jgi:hypothetical protein
MTRINRNAIVGAAAVVLSLLAAPAALAVSTAEAPDVNKAQVEYQERTETANQASPGWQYNKAYLEYKEQQEAAQQGASQSTSSNAAPQKAYVEYLERQALAASEPSAPAPVDASGVSLSAWQLGLIALAGAVIGGAAVGGVNSRRHTPQSGPGRREPVPA